MKEVIREETGGGGRIRSAPRIKAQVGRLKILCVGEK